MKRILIISVLLLAVVFSATADRRRMLMSNRPAAAAAGITADLYQTFEVSSITGPNLDASDNTSTGSWSVTDGSALLSTSATAEQALLNPINGSLDTGHTNGMARSFSATATATPTFDIGAGNVKTAVSAGCWFRYSGNPTVNKRIMLLYGTSAELVRVDFQYATDTVTFNGAATSNAVALAENTTYWIGVNANKNGTSYLGVYSVIGAQIGNTVTVTAANQDWRYWQTFGSSEISDSGVTFYWDDLAINWSSPTFPFGP